MNRSSFVVFLFISSIFLVGCGASLGPVSGVVTINGKPTSGVEVNFEPKDPSGATGTGYTNSEGKYELHFPGNKKGVPPGEYTVRLAGGELDDQQAAVKIPAEYNSKSTQVRTVKSGGGEFNFDVKTK